ncbi:hypothetical protein [Lederbergia citrisecunda]|nr:hypothetical protein [Lederbergia citrisecunda]
MSNKVRSGYFIRNLAGHELGIVPGSCPFILPSLVCGYTFRPGG